jgi:hypothetical protein
MSDNTPTPSEILSLADDQEYVFSGLHEKFREDETYYELDFKAKLGLPDEYADHGVVLPTARSNVDTFADYIDITNARVTVSRRDETKAGRESADQLQKFGMGMIYMTNVQGIVSPWRVASKHYPLYGLAVFKTVFSADRWPDKPEKKKRESDEAYADRLSKWMNEREGAMPILIQAVNPLVLYFDTATMGEAWVIERYEKPVSDVLWSYKGWSNPKDKKGKDKVDYINYCDRDYRCVLLDGEPVLKVKGGVAEHGYGFTYYTLIDAGLGNVDSSGDLSKRFAGINRHLHDILISQSRDYSIVDIIVANNGMPPGVLEGDDAEKVGNLDLRFGIYTPLPKGVTVKAIVPTMAPDQVTQHYSISGDIIDGFAIPRSLRGQSESGVRSGADRRQILAAAQYRLRYSEMAFKHRTAEVLNKCARILKNVVPGDIRVFSHTPADEFEDVIEKDKIREPINYHVEFAPVSEEDEYRRHDDIERLKQTGIATTEWARRQISTMNAKDLHRQELKDMARQSPAYQNMVSMYLDTKARQAMAARLGAEALVSGSPSPVMGASPSSQQPPQGGQMAGMASPTRQVPPLGSAEAMQAKMKGMRSQTPMKPMQGRAPNAGGSQNSWQR